MGIARQHGIPRSEMIALCVLARIKVREGDVHAAHALFVQCHAIARQTKANRELIETLVHYGVALKNLGAQEQSYLLLALAAQSQPDAGLEITRRAVQHREALRAILTPDCIEELEKRCQELSVENALEIVLIS